MTIEYPTNKASLPDFHLTWNDSDGALIDFSSGWTFTLYIGRAGVATVTKTTGITGYSTDPNVRVLWADNELDDLAAGKHVLQIKATRTSDGKDRYYTDTIEFTAAAMG